MRRFLLGSALAITAWLPCAYPFHASPSGTASHSVAVVQPTSASHAQSANVVQPAAVSTTAAQSTLSDGVIEGFYGQPWSTSDTKAMIAFLHAHGLNTFVYAPKNDPYQRFKWRQPYPAQQFAKLQQMVEAAQSHHVTFVASLSPGNNIEYSSKTDMQSLTAKVDQLRQLGVSTLLLSFDDIPNHLNATDNRIYHSNLALAQSDLANHLLAYEHARDPDFRLIFVPTVYSGVATNPYWQTLRSRLNPTVPIVWTGHGVLSEHVTAAEVVRVKSELGHPLVIWDNYPVNDFTYVQTHHPQLFLGPVKGRDKAVPALVAGYWFNPMLQARASELPLWTAADYLRKPSTYQPEASWQAALHAIGGPAQPALQLLAQDASTYGEQVTPPAPAALSHAITRYWQHPTSDTATNNLASDFKHMAAVSPQLQKSLPDRQLWAELAPFAQVLSDEGTMGQVALQLQSERAKHQSVTALRDRLAKLYQHRMNNPRIVAGTAVETFVKRVLKQSP